MEPKCYFTEINLLIELHKFNYIDLYKSLYIKKN